jgi:hypothetical protein
MLDALDEVPRTDYRGFVNMVRTWEGSEAAVRASIVLTSRIAGYLPLMWPREQVVELLRFSADDVNVYINSRGFDRATEAAVRAQLRTPAVAAMARPGADVRCLPRRPFQGGVVRTPRAMLHFYIA